MACFPPAGIAPTRPPACSRTQNANRMSASASGNTLENRRRAAGQRWYTRRTDRRLAPRPSRRNRRRSLLSRTSPHTAASGKPHAAAHALWYSYNERQTHRRADGRIHAAVCGCGCDGGTGRAHASHSARVGLNDESRAMPGPAHAKHQESCPRNPASPVRDPPPILYHAPLPCLLQAMCPARRSTLRSTTGYAFPGPALARADEVDGAPSLAAPSLGRSHVRMCPVAPLSAPSSCMGQQAGPVRLDAAVPAPKLAAADASAG